MKDWFKARNIWGAAMSALTDEEAGRLAKAIWAYTMDGEVRELQGAGKGILAMILMTLGQDAEKDDRISEVRAIAGKKGGLNTSYGKHQQMMAKDSKCYQMQAKDSKCSNKNKNIDKEQESESESFMDDDSARLIQSEQNRVLDAAEDAGMKMSNDVRTSLIALYADYGLEKMLDGFRSCVKHGAVNLAYLEAVLKGKPRKTGGGFQQRDYSGMDDELMDSLAKEMADFKAKEVG